jgi:hypothetical protein
MNKTRFQFSVLMTAAAFGGLASASYGFGEFDRGSLLLETTATATYDSYFIGAPSGFTQNGDRKDPGSDYYFSLHPNLKYDRKAGLGEISGYVGVDILRYDKNTNFNAENVSAALTAKLPNTGSRLNGELNLSYIESENVDFDVLDRVKQKSTNLGGFFTYQLGLKMALSETFNFTHVDREDFSDQTMFHNDLSYRYSNFLEDTSLRITESFDRTKSNGDNVRGAQLDQTSNSISGGLTRHIFGPVDGEAVYGYRFMDRNPSETQDHQRHFNGSFYSFNLHGPFLPPRYFPKVETSASITYQQSQNPGINDTGDRTVTGEIRAAWQARPQTKLTLMLNRSVELTATDLSVNTTNLMFYVSENVGYNTSVSANVGYIWRTYPNTDRSDDTLQANVNVTHHFNKYWSAGISYQYQNNKTNGSLNDPYESSFNQNYHDFSRNVINVFVTNVF